MSDNYLPCVETTVNATDSGPVDASIIWLHGLGANGHDFESIVPELRIPNTLSIRFVFPHAPNLPVTINNGFMMPAWYDILDMSLDRQVDETQLRQSAKATQALIDREIERGTPSEQVIVAGFSQGGAVGFEAALTYPQTLGGLLVLSSYFATANSIQIHPANQQLPIQIFHGTQDDVVAEQLGRRAVTALKNKGFTAQYDTFPMPHAVCMEEIQAISDWLQQRLQ